MHPGLEVKGLRVYIIYYKTITEQCAMCMLITLIDFRNYVPQKIFPLKRAVNTLRDVMIVT